MTLQYSAKADDRQFAGDLEPDAASYSSASCGEMNEARGFTSGTAHGLRQGPYVRFGMKRALDILIASLGILFFLPVFIAISIAILCTDGFPIFFKHGRVGRNGKSFNCLKFRTMVKDSDELLRKLIEHDPALEREWNQTYKLRNDPRIHSLGAILRKSSLDELPQLLNVLRGDMSIVGPRPIVADEISRYKENFYAFSSVRPGLTGLWQVNGRSDTTYSRRIDLDLRYIRAIGLLADVGILLKTIKVVVAGRGSF